MKSGIAYKLTFPSGKVYIGITRETLSQRVRRHISYARSGKPYALSAAIRKYGEDSFSAEVVASGTWEELKQIEIRLISEYNSLRDGGYNMTGGGEGSRGIHMSEITKKKISAALTGRKLSEDHRRRVSESQRGKRLSEETKQRMRNAAAKRCAEPMPEDQRAKIADALRGRKRPEEVMARIWSSRRANVSGMQSGDQHQPPSLAEVAQLVEQLPCKQQVHSSSLCFSTMRA